MFPRLGSLSQSGGAGSFSDDGPAPFSQSRRTSEGRGIIAVSRNRRMKLRLEDGDVRDVDLTSGQLRQEHGNSCNVLPFLVHALRKIVAAATCCQFTRSRELAANAHTCLISRNERRFLGCPRTHCIRFGIQAFDFKDGAQETAPFPETLGASQGNKNPMNGTCCQLRRQ